MKIQQMLRDQVLLDSKYHLMLDSMVAYCMQIIPLRFERDQSWWSDVQNIPTEQKCPDCLARAEKIRAQRANIK